MICLPIYMSILISLTSLFRPQLNNVFGDLQLEMENDDVIEVYQEQVGGQ